MKSSEIDAHLVAENEATKRVGALRAYSPTLRDTAIIADVYKHRFLSPPLINALHFPKGALVKGERQTHSNCLHRLTLLHQHGYLHRLPIPQEQGGRRSYAYILARKGAETLADIWGCTVADLDWDRTERNIRPSSIPHFVAMSAVRVAVMLSIRNHPGFQIEQWLDSRELKRKQSGVKVMITTPEGKRHHVSVEPDMFFLLSTPRPDHDEPSRYYRFVEVDLGTEPVEANSYDRSSIIKKVLSYLEFYRSEQYQRLYEARGMVILTVTTTERRLTSILKVAAEAGGRGRFWGTTFDRISNADILTDPTVWSVATREDRSSLVW
jgi:hypothetical protein